MKAPPLNLWHKRRSPRSSRVAAPRAHPHFMRDLALVYSAWPCFVFPPTTANPLTPNAFRAAATALIQGLFLEAAEFALDTNLPDLFFTKSFFFKPPLVCDNLPWATRLRTLLLDIALRTALLVISFSKLAVRSARVPLTGTSEALHAALSSAVGSTAR